MSESKSKNIALAAVCISTTWTFAVLHYVARRKSGMKITLDEKLIRVSTISVILACVLMILASIFGNLGDNELRLPDGDEYFDDRQGATFICTSIAHFATFVANLSGKMSILMFYESVFPQSAFKMSRDFSKLYMYLWGFSLTLAFFLLCFPPIDWLRSPIKDLQLGRGELEIYPAYAVSDIIIDFLILTMPIGRIMKLQFSPMEKVGVMCAFLLGSLVIAIGIVRTTEFYKARKLAPVNPDVSYWSAPVLYWDIAKSVVTMIAAGASTLRPLFSTSLTEPFVIAIKSMTSLHSFSSHSTEDSHTTNDRDELIHNRSRSSSSAQSSIEIDFDDDNEEKPQVEYLP